MTTLLFEAEALTAYGLRYTHWGYMVIIHTHIGIATSAAVLSQLQQSCWQRTHFQVKVVTGVRVGKGDFLVELNT